MNGTSSSSKPVDGGNIVVVFTFDRSFYPTTSLIQQYTFTSYIIRVLPKVLETKLTLFDTRYAALLYTGTSFIHHILQKVLKATERHTKDY